MGIISKILNIKLSPELSRYFKVHGGINMYKRANKIKGKIKLK